MRIVTITDTHGGARSDNPHFYEYQKKFYDNVFFPYIDQYKPDAFVHLGDIVENRKTMHYSTLKHLREDFLNPLSNFNIEKVFIAGNHDSHYRDNLSINAMREFVDFGKVVDKPEPLFDRTMLFIPWICKDNKEACEAAIHESQAEYCFGHFELKGFKNNDGFLSKCGDDASCLRAFRGVYSGHYHDRSRQGNVTYLGSAFEFIWSDYQCFRGFSVLDTDTGQLQFFRNPYHIFSTSEYTTGCELTPGDIEKIRGTYCRVFRKDDGSDDVSFNDYVKRIEDIGVIDLQLVQECDTRAMEIVETPMVTDNLKDIMLNYIDNQQFSNPEIIKDRFAELYGRAQNG